MLLQAEVGGRGQAGEMREPSVLNLPREGRGIGCRGGGRQWTECGRNREAWVEAVGWMVGTEVVWQLVPCPIPSICGQQVMGISRTMSTERTRMCMLRQPVERFH